MTAERQLRRDGEHRQPQKSIIRRYRVIPTTWIYTARSQHRTWLIAAVRTVLGVVGLVMWFSNKSWLPPRYARDPTP